MAEVAKNTQTTDDSETGGNWEMEDQFEEFEGESHTTGIFTQSSEEYLMSKQMSKWISGQVDKRTSQSVGTRPTVGFDFCLVATWGGGEAI